MRRLILGGAGLGALASLGMMIGLALSVASAMESSDDAGYAFQGRLVNTPAKLECLTAGEAPVCAFSIKGIAVSDDGEVIQRTVIGTTKGRAEEPGDVSPNRAHVLWTYPDGSTMLLRSTGTSEVGEDGSKVIAGSKYCVGGSGRFADADCSVEWSLHSSENGLRNGTFAATVTPKLTS